MQSRIVPSRLYKVKIFESVEKFRVKNEGKGDRHLLTGSDVILEVQINEWIKKDKVLVVSTGPLSFSTEMSMIDTWYSHDRLVEERRSVSVIYVPPMEKEDYVYGENPGGATGAAGKAVPEVAKQPRSSNKMSSRRISDGSG